MQDYTTYHFSFNGNFGEIKVNEQPFPDKSVVIQPVIRLVELSMQAQFMEGFCEAKSKFDALTFVAQYADAVFNHSHKDTALDMNLPTKTDEFTNPITMVESPAELPHIQRIARTMPIGEIVAFLNNTYKDEAITLAMGNWNLEQSPVELLWQDLTNRMDEFTRKPYSIAEIAAIFSGGWVHKFDDALTLRYNITGHMFDIMFEFNEEKAKQILDAQMDAEFTQFMQMIGDTLGFSFDNSPDEVDTQMDELFKLLSDALGISSQSNDESTDEVEDEFEFDDDDEWANEPEIDDDAIEDIDPTKLATDLTMAVDQFANAFFGESRQPTKTIVRKMNVDDMVVFLSNPRPEIAVPFMSAIWDMPVEVAANIWVDLMIELLTQNVDPFVSEFPKAELVHILTSGFSRWMGNDIEFHYIVKENTVEVTMNVF